jgi:hypothetical protein
MVLRTGNETASTSEQAYLVSYAHTKDSRESDKSLDPPSHNTCPRIYTEPNPSTPWTTLRKWPGHALPCAMRAFRVLAPAPPLPPPTAPVRLLTILKGPLRVLPNPALLLLLSFILSSALADHTGSLCTYAFCPRRSPVKKVKILSAPVALRRLSDDGLSGGSVGGRLGSCCLGSSSSGFPVNGLKPNIFSVAGASGSGGTSMSAIVARRLFLRSLNKLSQSRSSTHSASLCSLSIGLFSASQSQSTIPSTSSLCCRFSPQPVLVNRIKRVNSTHSS